MNFATDLYHAPIADDGPLMSTQTAIAVSVTAGTDGVVYDDVGVLKRGNSSTSTINSGNTIAVGVHMTPPPDVRGVYRVKGFASISSSDVEVYGFYGISPATPISGDNLILRPVYPCGAMSVVDFDEHLLVASPDEYPGGTFADRALCFGFQWYNPSGSAVTAVVRASLSVQRLTIKGPAHFAAGYG